ncbi:MAG: D-ribose pyranase [Negativicutes bacterium]
MKKQGMLNSEIAKVLADMGHADSICIADCGLPIPEGVKRIDIALKLGSPSFLETLEAVLADMQVEEVILAEEICVKNYEIAQAIEDLFDEKTSIEYCGHEQFKEKTKNCKAIIRTGECSPYANIILKSGVIF